MTPKEKAQELYRKMVYEIEWNAQPSTVKGVAKQCALIAIDEILNCPQMNDQEVVKYSDGSWSREIVEIPNKYWQEVKQEIEKL